MSECWGWIEEPRSLKEEAAVQSGGTVLKQSSRCWARKSSFSSFKEYFYPKNKRIQLIFEFVYLRAGDRELHMIIMTLLHTNISHRIK